MMQTLVRPDHWALERAMRIWALTDERCWQASSEATGGCCGAVRQAFVDYGFDDDEADLRSAVLFAAGVGLLHEAGFAPRTRPQPLRERVLDLMLRR